MSEIWKTGPAQPRAVTRIGRLMIGLAEQLRLAGRHSDAKAMIDMAFQQFDTELAEALDGPFFFTDRMPLHHTNDNHQWANPPLEPA